MRIRSGVAKHLLLGERQLAFRVEKRFFDRIIEIEYHGVSRGRETMSIAGQRSLSFISPYVSCAYLRYAVEKPIGTHKEHHTVVAKVVYFVPFDLRSEYACACRRVRGELPMVDFKTFPLALAP